ncbi:hypothetical protein GGR51DRAFT_537143 [Nemania sp. FL0031]|nr:hypothetical protein GGR51DRAFT_537143 [Nemania sp. FL0031]
MSHLAPQAAIFSPSIARAAASTAKDWAYVDSWLRRQFTHLHQSDPSVFSKSTPPTFERNPETLAALLALVAANEEADEERDRLARLEASALAEVRAAEDEKARRRNGNSNTNASTDTACAEVHGDLLAEDLLQALDSGLTKEGLTALDAMADVSLTLGTPADPSPTHLAHRFAEQTGALHETEHLLHRVSLLQSYLADESARLAAFLEELRLSPQYQLPLPLPTTDTNNEGAGEAGLIKENTALELALKAATTRLPSLQRQVEALKKRVGIPSLTVEEVLQDEEAYLRLLARKKELDAQVRAFAGLPPDVEAARVELENLRAQLREATERRDADFEMLVERESPVKVRRNSRRF